MKTHLFHTLPQEWAGRIATKAALVALLWSPMPGWSQLQVGLGSPPDGASFLAGDELPLSAVVTNDGSVVTGLDFLANGVLLGPGQPDPHGEWEYTDGSHLSVMHGMFGETMDYSSAGMAEFFIIDGQYVTPTVFVGEFTTWVEGNPFMGATTVTLSFTADGKLNAVMDGAAPLGKRTLSAGTRFGEETPFTFNWPAVPAGSYTLEAVAKYGASQTVTSAPVHVTVVGGKRHSSALVKNLTRTATHDQNWQDQDNQLAVSWSGVHVAWRATATSADNSVTTNRIYYSRSLDNGATFEPWVLLEERTESGYSISSQWMAVDGWDVHIITLAEGYTDGDGNHGQRLQYHRSTDGGATFEPPVLLGSTAPGESFGAALITASYERVSVAIPFGKELHSPSIKFLHSADRGANFGGSIIPALNPVLAQLVQDGEQVCLTWQDQYEGGFFSDGRAHVSCSTDGGATLTTTALEEIPDGSGANHLDRPLVAFEGTNVLALFLVENTNATPVRAELHLRRSTDSGATFGAYLNLAPDLDPQVEVPADAAYDIALDGTNVCVVFGTTGNQLYLVRSTDGGATFGTPLLLADAAFNGGAPMAVIPRLARHSHAPGALHLLWSGCWYQHSTDNGVTWTPPVNLLLQYSGWLYDPTPQAAADAMGALHWNVNGHWQHLTYNDQDLLYRSFRHAAAPAGSLNFGAQFGQVYTDNLRFDNLQLPASTPLQPSGAFSVECWVRMNGTTNWHDVDLVAKRGPLNTYNEFDLQVTDDGFGSRTFAATLYFGGIEVPTARNALLETQPNVWYHVAATYDPAGGADNLKLYVSGELQGTATAAESPAASPQPWVIGRFLDGAMDDLRFWNRALTAQEVRDRFTGPLVGDESGLVAYYTFDGTWADSTGHCLPAVPMYQEAFGAGADVLPFLQVERVSGSQVRLSWTTFGAGYAPQYVTDLGSANWQAVSGTPTLVNGRWTLTTDAAGRARFFRLQR